MALDDLNRTEALRDEALRYSKYLLGREPAAEMVERYVAANQALFEAGASGSDRAILDFCRRHPASLGCLDSAAGVLRPDSLLRKKILVMAAILEAAPGFASDFMRDRTSAPVLVLGSVWWASTAAVKILIGAVLLLTLQRPGA